MKAIATLILFLCSFGLFSQCISGDCINGIGKLQDPNSVYEGNFLNGKKNGKGTQVFSSGARFEGDFLNGLKNGKGIYTWADGTRYEGDFLQGSSTGKGKKTWADGTRYEGDFLQGSITGKGTYYDSNGTKRYVGDWLDGEKSGKGKFFSTEGTLIAEGDWLHDNLSGKVKLYDKNGRLSYEGEFLDGEANGKGILYFPNGNRYEGGVLKLLPNGAGTFFQTDGLKFAVFYEKGEAKGEVICTNASGRIEEGRFVFKDGNFVKQNEFVDQESRKRALVCTMNLASPKPPYNFVDNRVMCVCCNKRYALYVDGGEENIVRAKTEFLSNQLAFHILENNLSKEHLVNDTKKLISTINELGGVYGPLYALQVPLAVISVYENAKMGMAKKQKTFTVDKYTNTSRYCGEECQRHCSN